MILWDFKDSRWFSRILYQDWFHQLYLRVPLLGALTSPDSSAGQPFSWSEPEREREQHRAVGQSVNRSVGQSVSDEDVVSYWRTGLLIYLFIYLVLQLTNRRLLKTICTVKVIHCHDAARHKVLHAKHNRVMGRIMIAKRVYGRYVQISIQLHTDTFNIVKNMQNNQTCIQHIRN